MKLPLIALLALLTATSCIDSVAAQAADDEQDESNKDRDRLVQFFHAADGKRWVNNTGWDTDAPPCEWFGVTCALIKTRERVTAIRLPNNGLQERVSKSIYEMRHLKTLDLKDNHLSDGGFAGLVHSEKLQLLNLGQNALTEIAGIGDAPDTLSELHLTENRIKDPFPIELTKLSNLEVLFLSFNKIRGTLPTEIGRMSFLREFYGYDNDIHGQLPTEIGLLNKVEIFTMAENKLTGTIPAEVENMHNLQTFSLHNDLQQKSQIGGRLPKFHTQPFLSEIYLDGNAIGGPIPSRLLLANNDTNSLITIGLSNNDLTGEIPIQLSRFNKLSINLVGNKIHHIPFAICSKTSWQNGLVEQFGCSAILCPIGYASEHGRQTNEEDACKKCPTDSLGNDYMGSVSCNGDGSQVLTEYQILAILFTDLGGESWQDQTGWEELHELLLTTTLEDFGSFSDDTSYCRTYFGITCNDNDEITEIRLPNNGLYGLIPTEVFQLPSLTVLDMSRNAVTITPGEGFSALSKSTSLESLHLSGTRVTDLRGIENAKSLRDLFLDGLSFQSTMPAEIFKLTKLHTLHASFSTLQGNLPTDIGLMTELKFLHLFANEFTGSLPSEVGQLGKLEILDFSQNKFTGEWPTEWDNLVKLKKLHLHQSEGDLSGSLPAFNFFPDIEELTVDSNSFDGGIPDNFLAGVIDIDRPLSIGLSFNKLSGSTPRDLRRFRSLDILLEGNMLAGLSDEYCVKDEWMAGEVGLVGSCDAIMCKPKYWNPYGKASSKLNATCMPCLAAEYYGSTYCGDETDPFPEKTILDKLYKSTGGPQYWKSAINWTTPGVGICHREHIECAGNEENAGVRIIRLNGNGLKGVVPPEIWDLPELELLGLTGNEVSLSFLGIEKVTKLKTLQVSNTNVRNVDNIDNAGNQLTEIHLAHNQLTGEIPQSILNLAHVQTLFLENSKLTGSIPAGISGMGNLNTLFLQGNDITGKIPTEIGLLANLATLALDSNLLSGNLPTEMEGLQDLARLILKEQRGKKKLSGPLLPFATSPKLSYLDLADNKFRGTVPSTLLESVNPTSEVYINLSNNNLHGAVPIELDNFSNLNIILISNKIDELPPDLCDDDNAAWMTGNVGQFKTCNAILCPKGTALPSGRQVESDKSCEPCPGGEEGAPYFGSTECNAGVVLTERDILVSVYQKLNGANWINQANWLSDMSVCTWYGVTCNDDDEVQSIILANNNLESDGNDVSELFFSLQNLRELDIKGNPVPLDLMQIPQTSELVSLQLSETGLPSLNGMSRAPDLRRFHANGNELGGELPAEIFDCVKLRTLYLSFNSFNGTLPSDVSKLSKMEEFYAYDNMLSGTIPTDVGLMTSLREFIMPKNFLTGTLPNEFGSLSKLEQLSLYDQKGDVVLSGPLPSFLDAPNLWYFDVTRNDFSGKIPDDFMANSDWTDDAVTVYLSFNDLTGTIPAQLDKFSSLDLGIVGNRFVSIPQMLCDNNAWMQNAVADIKSCDAIACAKGSYSETGRQEVAGEPCSPCNIGLAATFIGQTSCEESDIEKGILKSLFDSTDGDNWNNRENWNSDVVPICSWFGVICADGEANDDYGVTSLLLPENNLVGMLPSDVYQLPYLRSLRVEDNAELDVALVGLGNADKLEVLYLSGVSIDSIDGISEATSLREIHLTDNGLTGTFPNELFELTSLEGVFMAFNSFSGTLPTRIGELTNLINFYMFDNELSGSLPSEIGSLSTLANIVLAENLISGTMPKEMSSMPALELLSMYRRKKPGPKLTGPLPPFDAVPQLKDLYLDHNDLSSTIPPDFLSSSADAALIELNFNRLKGTVPVSLNFLNAVNLQLSGNKITAFPPEFCDNSEWMDGLIGTVGCDAFLCPPHTSNIIGRANETLTCDECPDDNTDPYYGAVDCNAAFSERTVLVRFYQRCGGSAWNNNDGWTTEANICTWYGITCDLQESVTKIELVSNNLVGTPDAELFTLPQLQVLALSSNPIDFSFQGIEVARKLFELRLDATGLSSIEGIGKSPSLITLDLRYNGFKGNFPEELLDVENLRDLNMGDNELTGSLPSTFAKLKYLRTLRLGSNKFEGFLPSFDDMQRLTTIDLSENFVKGTIPDTFLYSLPANGKIEVNLASNSLRGTVPASLERFERLTIYLRENRISGIAENLCDQDAWNDNDVEKYGCDGILCPPGTYNYLGRQSDQATRCIKCGDPSPYYGQVTCADSSSGRSSLSLLASLLGGAVVVMALF